MCSKSHLCLCCSCAGGELFHECVIEESFVEKDVVHLLVQILEGLCFLHESNIVHLDLKVSCLAITHTHAHTRTHARTHACTCMHTHPHSLTYTHTHSLSLSLSFPCPIKSPYYISLFIIIMTVFLQCRFAPEGLF